VQPWPEGESGDLPSPNTGVTPQCLVLNCSGAADQVWTDVTVETRNHLVTWPVCRRHHQRLRAGEPWQAMTGGPRSYRRWILMGDDLTATPSPHPGQRPRLGQADEDREVFPGPNADSPRTDEPGG
jgi:hypothetical protein